MNLPYMGNIPDPPHNPSTDVPNMQINTNSVQTWTTLDHFGFGVTAGGWHQFVHLFNMAAPSLVSGSATADGVLYASAANPFWKNAAGINQLAFLGATSITPPTGYITLGGLIIQFGKVTNPSATSGTVTYPTPFLANTFGVFFTLARNASSSDSIWINTAGTNNLTQFAWKSSTSLSNPTDFFYWLAIGN